MITINLSEKMKSMSLKKIEGRILEIRKQFYREFELMSPSVSFDYSKKEYQYGFSMDGFGTIIYEIPEWDWFKEDKDEMCEKIIFHFSRFLRKWYVNAPDILIERKLIDKPFVIEYGFANIDNIENESFKNQFDKISNSRGIFWESDYVAEDEMVIYVFGKDYYIPQFNEDSETLIKEIIKPIYEENEHLLN